MKKILFVAVLTAFSLSLNAQSAEMLFSKYSKEMHSESVKVGPLMMSFARLCADDSEDADMLSHINSVRVLSLEECSDRVKEDFRKDALKLDNNGMELLMEISDNED